MSWLALQRRILQTTATPFQIGKRWYVAQSTLNAVNRFLNEWEYAVMPSKNKSRGVRNGFPETTFIQFKLNGEQKKEFENWLAKTGTNLDVEISLFMSEGMKTSVSYDEDNARWIVASTCVDEDSPNHRCCITSRSAEWYTGLAMNVFKAKVLMEKVAWSEFAADDGEG